MMAVREARGAAHAERAQPRPRVRPLWRRRWVLPLIAALGIGGVAGVGWWTVASGEAARFAGAVKWSAISATATLGFQVDEVMVSGRRETPRDDLIHALNVARGAPILGVDLAAAKERIEKLPWVRATTVERMLPDTVLVSIVEREPLALWQKDGHLSLIDAEGTVILRDGLESYRDLMMVVGEGAEKHAAELIAMLGTQPELMRYVQSATWVGGRRWNLHLSGGIDVRMPEQEPGAAWMRLAEYQKTHKVLEKDVSVLDLRIPDRLIVKTGPKGGSGQET